MRLWVGQAVSQLGSWVTGTALPYTAILLLNATPAQMGLLGAAGNAPLLLFGLFAGVWVDRVRRRPLMIAADLGRALLLFSVPCAYLLGWLGMAQLYVVAVFTGALSVCFDVAYASYLPRLVAREQLVEGNSKLGMSASLAEITGPPTGGALVQLVGGPLAILLDVASFLLSAVALWRIRTPEQRPTDATVAPAGVLSDARTGLLAIWSSPLLRPIAIVTAIGNFFGWFFGAVYALYGLRTLGFSPAIVGLTIACGGLGSLVGALLVTPATRRFGLGPSIIGGLLISAACSGLIWLAGGWPLAALLLMFLAQFVGDAAHSVAELNQLSLRQAITPEHLLGRVNAGMHVLGQGVGTLGILVGGLLGETIGLRPTVAIAALGGLAGALWLLASPLRRLRRLDAPAES
jgi:MFS family permease